MPRRSTKKGDDPGSTDRCFPLSRSFEFKRLVKALKKLPADRQEAFNTWLDSEIEEEGARMPKAPKKPTQEAPMTGHEIEQLVTEVVRRELSALVDKAGERSQGTGSKVTKRTVSVPSDLWVQFRRECPGAASQHVTAAIRLYLATRETGQA